MIPRYPFFSRKKAKRKTDDLMPVEASIANEAAMKELKADLAHEVSVLRADIRKLREQREELFREIQAIMLTKSRDDYHHQDPLPYSNASFNLDPTLDETPSADNARRTAWRIVDRKARALQNSRLIPQPITSISPSMPQARAHANSSLLRAAPVPRARNAVPQPRYASWATWMPDPSFAPSPLPVQFNLVAPQYMQGLFGPLSPRNSLHGHGS